jgi:hypothetical protein
MKRKTISVREWKLTLSVLETYRISVNDAKRIRNDPALWEVHRPQLSKEN